MAGKPVVQDAPATALSAAVQTSPFIALIHRDFRLLLAGRWMATLGNQMQTVAIAYQVYHIHNSTIELGLIGICRFVPVLILSLLGGVLADAVDRRRLLLITQPVLLACAVSLAAFTALGWASLGVIYAVCVVSAAVSAIDNPAGQAIVPALVPREHLPNALSWNITTNEVAMIAGPAIGGIAIAVIGLAGTYAIGAATVVALFLALVFMHARLGAAAIGNARGWRAALEGVGFIRGNRIVLSVMGLDFCAMFWGSATVLLPALADRVLHVGTATLGILFAAPAVGSVLGAAAMTFLSNRVHKPGWPLLLAVVVYGVATVGVGLSRSVPLTLVCLAVTGGADTISMTLRHQIMQLLTPNALRGRVTAANQIFVQSGPQLGQLEAGVVANGFGVPFSIASGGVACVLNVILIALLVPAIRRYRNAL